MKPLQLTLLLLAVAGVAYINMMMVPMIGWAFVLYGWAIVLLIYAFIQITIFKKIQ